MGRTQIERTMCKLDGLGYGPQQCRLTGAVGPYEGDHAGKANAIPRMGLPETRQVGAGAGNTEIKLHFFADGLEVAYATTVNHMGIMTDIRLEGNLTWPALMIRGGDVK